MSIRAKFILALLLTSLASTAVVGGVAYYRLMRKFDALVLQTASQNFRQDVSTYFRTYGSWEEGQRHESFREFSERRRRASGLPPRGGPGLRTDLPPPMPIPADVRLDPLTTERRPPPPGGNLHRPPFRFYLFDVQHRALSPIPPYRIGDAMRAAEHARIQPIELDGKVVAYFSPQGQINYSDLDFGYLAAMRDALTYGLVAAALLTMLLGLIFGNRLSAALRRLTDAVHAVGDGELKQHVLVTSRDEVGVLAQAFNRMSDEIAQSHENIRQSHEQIRQQAAAVCESLRLQIEGYPWHELHPDLKVTMSMGLDANLRGGSVDAMLTAADGLLYLAKSSGRNRVCSAESAASA